MAYKFCPRCHRLMPQGVQYCDTCRPIAEAELMAYHQQNASKKAALYNRKRDPRYLAFYRSKAWRTMSKAHLEKIGYQCEARLPGCTRLAVEVHHIKPIQTPEGWDLRLDPSNLEGVCTSCHNIRHERGKTRTAPDVLDLRAIQRGLAETPGGMLKNIDNKRG